MKEKVQKVGVEKESGYLYFVDKQGDISRSLMARGGKKGGKASKVKKLGVEKDDKQGDISRSSMNRGGKENTKKKVVKKSAGKGKKK
ncbi:MAG: hypothetical protein LBN19_02045 [Endomicrobium sp.]|jgi:hypothetical protein|nr:hypothetical protein [Endomicrobium sp.]